MTNKYFSNLCVPLISLFFCLGTLFFHTASFAKKADKRVSEVYFVIGVFKTEKYANRLKELHKQFRPSILRGMSNGKRVYRVTVGPVIKSEENRIKANLHKAGLKDLWKLRISTPNPEAPKKTSKAPLKLDKVIGKKKELQPDKKVSKKVVRAKPKKKNLQIAPQVIKPQIKKNLRPGDKFSDCKGCPELVVIPAGNFLMGKIDGGVTGDAMATKVKIPQNFAIGRFEVTFEEWDKCVSEGGCNGYSPEDEGWGRGKQPVTNINWQDAWNFTAWLSVKTGSFYRLPSEAEWEYAARGGTATNYWWGNELGINQAVCQNCGSVYDDKQAAPVGMFSSNPFGLYDTAGNLWEWVQDCYSPSAYQKHKSYPKPVEGANNCGHVLRGGGWDVIGAGLESTFRFTSGGGNRLKIFGFRVVRELN